MAHKERSPRGLQHFLKVFLKKKKRFSMKGVLVRIRFHSMMAKSVVAQRVKLQGLWSSLIVTVRRAWQMTSESSKQRYLLKIS